MQIKASIVHLKFGHNDIVQPLNKKSGSYVVKDKSLYFDTNEEGVYLQYFFDGTKNYDIGF